MKGQTREGNPIVGFIAVTQLQVAQGKLNFHHCEYDTHVQWYVYNTHPVCM